MQQLSEHRAWPRLGRTLGIAATLLCATALGQPYPVYAGPHGGFHGGFADIRNGFGERHEGFRGGFIAYPWWGYPPDYGYDNSQPYSSQTWYYCSGPAGYHPYVTQCSTGWQTAPAG